MGENFWEVILQKYSDYSHFQKPHFATLNRLTWAPELEVVASINLNQLI